MNTIKKGSRGDDVRTLQRLLNLNVDGIFGDLTFEGVKAFQKANGLFADGVVGAKTWAKLIKVDDNGALIKSVRNITEIIIHCSATREGMDFTVDDIRKWHLARDFSDIGYHYVIYRDGSIHKGRDINISGAHCKNHNYKSIGICYIGGMSADGSKTKDTRTEAQKKTLRTLLKDLKKLYPNATIHGHNEFANKECPCFNVQREYLFI